MLEESCQPLPTKRSSLFQQMDDPVQRLRQEWLFPSCSPNYKQLQNTNCSCDINRSCKLQFSYSARELMPVWLSVHLAAWRRSSLETAFPIRLSCGMQLSDRSTQTGSMAVATCNHKRFNLQSRHFSTRGCLHNRSCSTGRRPIRVIWYHDRR